MSALYVCFLSDPVASGDDGVMFNGCLKYVVLLDFGVQFVVCAGFRFALCCVCRVSM